MLSVGHLGSFNDISCGCPSKIFVHFQETETEGNKKKTTEKAESLQATEAGLKVIKRFCSDISSEAPRMTHSSLFVCLFLHTDGLNGTEIAPQHGKQREQHCTAYAAEKKNHQFLNQIIES